MIQDIKLTLLEHDKIEALEQRVNELFDRLATLEAKFTLLAKKLGVEFDEDQDKEPKNV